MRGQILTPVVVLIILTGVQSAIGLFSRPSNKKRIQTKQGSYAQMQVHDGLPSIAWSYAFPQSPVVGFQRDIYSYGHTSETNNSERNWFLVLLMLFSLATNQLRTSDTSTTATAVLTTTTTALTVDGGTCRWSPWSSCSEACRGERSRTRTCLGKTYSESETCNTETGFLPDGIWYRAANCHDYNYVINNIAYEPAKEECTKLGARLASTGMRDDTIRADVFNQFALFHGVTISPAWLGIYKGVTGEYEWSDGYIGYPTFWKAGEPSWPLSSCHYMPSGNPFGLRSAPTCSSISYFLCERQYKNIESSSILGRRPT